jgi:hypothetical protein
VSLDGEPSNPNLPAAPGQPVAYTDETVTKKISKRPVNEPKDDPDLRQKLLAAGAIVAAGVTIVLGVRHFQGEVEPVHEDTTHLFKRKAKDAKHKAQHKAQEAKHKAQDAGGDAGGEGKNLLQEAGDKVSAAASATGEKAHDVYDAAASKAAELQHDAKDKVEHETKKADAKAASPAAIVEQRRMTYGQDEHGRPKGPVKDAGFLGFRNWFPGAKGDSV